VPRHLFQHSLPLSASAASLAVFKPWLVNCNSRQRVSAYCGPPGTARAVAAQPEEFAAVTAMA
jgi:hypothetical protein